MFKIFGRHYGTERFFIMIFVCMAAMFGFIFYGSRLNAINNRETISTTALYTETYMWSRTSATGSVVNYGRNADGTKVFVLLHNDGDASDIDASKYTVYMKSRDGKLMNNPTMTVFAYGNTGYIGFYFTDSRGFANQVLSMIIRNDSVASDMATAQSMAKDAERDESFVNHNQIRLFMNFGASEMPELEVLNEPIVNPVHLFADTVTTMMDGTDIANQYRTYTGYNADFGGTMNAVLNDMYEELRSINQYRSDLQSQGIVVPDLPYYIADDKINNIPNDFSVEPSVFSNEMLDGISTGSSGTNFLNYDSNISENTMDVSSVTSSGATYEDAEGNLQYYYYLHTDYLFPGTVNFEWQGKPLSSGFISDLYFYKDYVPNITMYGAYKSYKEWYDDTSSDKFATKQMPRRLNGSGAYDSWRKADGSFIDRTEVNDILGINSKISQYETAVNNYLESKYRYADMLNTLLEYESKIQVLGDSAITTNARPENLYLYGDR